MTLWPMGEDRQMKRCGKRMIRQGATRETLGYAGDQLSGRIGGTVVSMSQPRLYGWSFTGR
jgi:hypothetical protein